MKRKIYWLFNSLLCLLLLILCWFVFYPAIPNTPTAKRGFREMTGLDPSEVRDIYYYYYGGGISGGDAEFLRFTYADDHWLQLFRERLALTRLKSSDGGLYVGGL